CLDFSLFQVIDTLLGGGEQRGARPLELIGDELVRGLLATALAALTPEQRLDLYPAPGLGRWARRVGLGSSQAQERTQWLIDSLARPEETTAAGAIRRACTEVALEPERACEFLCHFIERTEPHNTA